MEKKGARDLSRHMAWPLMLLAAVALTLPLSVYASSIGLIYIESNTGGASGGHLAIEAQGDIFHFQQFDDGYFRLVRQSWNDFRHIYNDLENRPIHIARTHCQESEVKAINRHFTRALLFQERNFANLDSLSRLEKLLKGAAEQGSIELEIKGLGYFCEQGCKRSPEMARLRDLVESEFGSLFISRQIQRLNQRISALSKRLTEQDEIAPAPIQMPSETRPIARAITVADLLEETLGLLNAFEILQQEKGLKRERLMEDGIPLEPAFIEILRRFSERLGHSILGLLKSPRQDKASDLLIQMARFVSVEKSIASGRLLILDPFPLSAPSVPYGIWRHDIEDIEKLYAVLRARIHAAKRLLIEKGRQRGEMDMLDYNKLENLMAMALELDMALKEHKAIRLLDGDVLPERSRRCRLPIEQKGIEGPCSKALSSLEATSAEYSRTLAAIYGYDLIEKNCVTELIRQIMLALQDEENIQGSGLHAALPPPGQAGFIPFVFFSYWIDHMPDSEVVHLPAYRIRRLRQLYASQGQGQLSLYLQECNTVTATIYRHHPVDTSFLLFTDDIVLLRPVYGGVNLAYSALNMAVGLLELPFDRASRFKQGFWGIIYSLPELIFSNIRKGSFVWTEEPP
jgi:hypothetical protein